MARSLRIIAMLSAVVALGGAAVALLSVWMAPDQNCAWKFCNYNGLYPPPPPPRTETIGLVVGPTLPFSVYWLLFIGILLVFVVALVSQRVPPSLGRIVSLITIGALALFVLDARLPIISSWTYPVASCGPGCGIGVPPVQYTLRSEWLFLWCLIPCCVAALAQYASLRLCARAGRGATADAIPISAHDGP